MQEPDVRLHHAPAYPPFATPAPLDAEAWIAALRAGRDRMVPRLRVAAAHELSGRAQWPATVPGHDQFEQELAQCLALDDAEFRRMVRVLEGRSAGAGLSAVQGAVIDAAISPEGSPALKASFDITHHIRFLAARHDMFWDDDAFQAWREMQPPEAQDLRRFADLLAASGRSPHAVAKACLRPALLAEAPQAVLPPERVWPFFALHPQYIDAGLGLAPAPPELGGLGEGALLNRALELVGLFPALPDAWVPRLAELALGEARSWRVQAQKALADVPGIGERAIEALADTRQEVRIAAAEWLAGRGEQSALPPLREALAKEKREAPRAALMSALEALGDNLSPLLSPALLHAQAKKALKASLPAGLDGFLFEALPACRWRDGGHVPAELVRWWVVLACKLKAPGGHPLIERYLGLLDESSRAALGLAVLRLFIAHDTRRPSLQEATAHAQNEVAHLIQAYRQFASRYPGHVLPESHESAFERLRQARLSAYSGTALGERGMLALATAVPGPELAATVLGFLREHPTRRAPFEQVLLAAAANEAPEAVQLLLTVARRHRTQAVQKRARALVDEIAERHGWTPDELADRTAPTAGFDARGVQPLSYGVRQFEAVLDAAMAVQLRHAEDGKPIRNLPPPRAGDDAEAVTKAKAQLAALRKELPLLIDAQRWRLYESMCTAREWPLGEWREWLQRHPVVGRLAQRLVWQTGTGQCFRPTEDGSLIDLHDEAFVPAAGASISLAHRSTLEATKALAWQKHFEDYKLVPLFDQLARPQPAPAQWADATAAWDRLGWFGDSGLMSALFARLGYQRGKLPDWNGDECFCKDFQRIGVRVSIGVSAQGRPGHMAAGTALKSLSFQRLRSPGRRQRVLALTEVPPIVRAEGWADYLALADICGGGFDPQWARKTHSALS